MRIEWIWNGTTEAVQPNIKLIRVWELVKEIGYCANELISIKADNFHPVAYFRSCIWNGADNHVIP